MRIIINIGSEALLLKKEAPLNTILNACEDVIPVERNYNQIWEPARFKETKVEVVVISDNAAKLIETQMTDDMAKSQEEGTWKQPE